MHQNCSIGISSSHPPSRNINLNNGAWKYLRRNQGFQVRDCSTWAKNRNNKGHTEEVRKERSHRPPPIPPPRPASPTYSREDSEVMTARGPQSRSPHYQANSCGPRWLLVGWLHVLSPYSPRCLQRLLQSWWHPGHQTSSSLRALRQRSSNAVPCALRQASSTPGCRWAPRNLDAGSSWCLLAPGCPRSNKLRPPFPNPGLPVPATQGGSCGFRWLPQLRLPECAMKAGASPHRHGLRWPHIGPRRLPQHQALCELLGTQALGFGGFLSSRLPKSPWMRAPSLPGH